MLKPVINAKEAVQHIRCGMSDEELMKEYVISARGLESLFNKLVKAGEIEQSELDRRQLRFQRSHIVSLAGLPTLEPRVAVIDPDDAVIAIRAGLSDELLMAEYNLSARGLASLFRNLIEEGHITEAELDRIKPSIHWADVAVTPDPPDDPLPEPVVEPQLSDTIHPKPISSGYRISKVYLAAIGGFILGVGAVLALIGLTNIAPDLKTGLWSMGGAKVIATGDLEQGVDSFIAILKAIEKEAEERGETDSFDTAASYRKCLEECEGLSYGHDDEDRALVTNCRHACIARYDKHFRQIQERFYERNVTGRDIR
jgi:hypothetical protein